MASIDYNPLENGLGTPESRVRAKKLKENEKWYERTKAIDADPRIRQLKTEFDDEDSRTAIDIHVENLKKRQRGYNPTTKGFGLSSDEIEDEYKYLEASLKKNRLANDVDQGKLSREEVGLFADAARLGYSHDQIYDLKNKMDKTSALEELQRKTNERSGHSDTYKAFAKFAPRNKALLANLGSFGADLLGAEELSIDLRKTAEEHEREAATYKRGVETWEEAKGLGGVVDFAYNSALDMALDEIPTLMLSAGAGTIGRVIAKSALKAGLKDAAKKASLKEVVDTATKMTRTGANKEELAELLIKQGVDDNKIIDITTKLSKKVEAPKKAEQILLKNGVDSNKAKKIASELTQLGGTAKAKLYLKKEGVQGALADKLIDNYKSALSATNKAAIGTAFAYNYSQIAGENWGNMVEKAKAAGVDPGSAVTLVSSLAGATMDTLAFLPEIKLLSKGFEDIGGSIAGYIGKLGPAVAATRLAGRQTAEGLTEAGQGFVSDLGAAYVTKDYESLTLDKQKKDRLNEFMAGLFGSAGVQAPRSITSTYNYFAEKRKADGDPIGEILKNNDRKEKNITDLIDAANGGDESAKRTLTDLGIHFEAEAERKIEQLTKDIATDQVGTKEPAVTQEQPLEDETYEPIADSMKTAIDTDGTDKQREYASKIIDAKTIEEIDSIADELTEDKTTTDEDRNVIEELYGARTIDIENSAKIASRPVAKAKPSEATEATELPTDLPEKMTVEQEALVENYRDIPFSLGYSNEQAFGLANDVDSLTAVVDNEIPADMPGFDIDPDTGTNIVPKEKLTDDQISYLKNRGLMPRNEKRTKKTKRGSWVPTKRGKELASALVSTSKFRSLDAKQESVQQEGVTSDAEVFTPVKTISVQKAEKQLAKETKQAELKETNAVIDDTVKEEGRAAIKKMYARAEDMGESVIEHSKNELGKTAQIDTEMAELARDEILSNEGKDPAIIIAALATRIAHGFRSPVVFFKSRAERAPAGFMSSHDFVALNSKRLVDNDGITTVMHEIAHAFRAKHPDLYSKLLGYINETGVVDLNDSRAEQVYKDAYQKSLTRQGIDVKDGITEEMISDVLGVVSKDKRFWERMQQREPSLFGDFAEKFMEILNKVRDIIGKSPRSDEAKRIVKDLDKTIEIFSEVMAEAAKRDTAAIEKQVKDSAKAKLIKKGYGLKAVEKQLRKKKPTFFKEPLEKNGAKQKFDDKPKKQVDDGKPKEKATQDVAGIKLSAQEESGPWYKLNKEQANKFETNTQEMQKVIEDLRADNIPELLSPIVNAIKADPESTDSLKAENATLSTQFLAKINKHIKEFMDTSIRRGIERVTRNSKYRDMLTKYMELGGKARENIDSLIFELGEVRGLKINVDLDVNGKIVSPDKGKKVTMNPSKLRRVLDAQGISTKSYTDAQLNGLLAVKDTTDNIRDEIIMDAEGQVREVQGMARDIEKTFPLLKKQIDEATKKIESVDKKVISKYNQATSEEIAASSKLSEIDNLFRMRDSARRVMSSNRATSRQLRALSVDIKKQIEKMSKIELYVPRLYDPGIHLVYRHPETGEAYRETFEDNAKGRIKVNKRKKWLKENGQLEIEKNPTKEEISKGKSLAKEKGASNSFYEENIPEDTETMFADIQASEAKAMAEIAVKRSGLIPEHGAGKDVLDAMEQFIMARGFGRHRLSRQGEVYKGYKRDNLGEVLMQYTSGYAGSVSKAQAAKEYAAILAGIPKSDENTRQWMSTKIKEELRNKNNVDAVLGRVRSLIFHYFLGGSMASALVNTTQNYIVGTTLLSQELGGGPLNYLKAVKMMASAQKSATGFQYGFANKNDKNYKEEKKLMDELMIEMATGTLTSEMGKKIAGRGAFQKAMEKRGMKLSGQKLDKAWDLFQKGSGFFFEQSETNNRLTAFLVHYRQFGDAQRAKDFVTDVHYSYDSWNKPLIFASGPMGKVAETAFGGLSTFAWNQWSQIYINGIKNSTGKGHFLGGLGVAALLLGGMPGSDILEEMYRRMRGRDLEKDTGKVWTYTKTGLMPSLGEDISKKVDETLGVKIGVPDISGSLELRTPPIIDLGLQVFVGKAKENPLAQITQNMSSIFTQKDEYGNPMSWGDIFIKSFTPMSVQKAFQGHKESTEGFTTSGGTPYVDADGNTKKLSAIEGIMRTIGGFNVVSRSEFKGTQWRGRSLQSQWGDWKGELVDRYINGDATVEDLMDFNTQVMLLREQYTKKFFRTNPIDKNYIKSKLKGRKAYE